MEGPERPRVPHKGTGTWDQHLHVPSFVNGLETPDAPTALSHAIVPATVVDLELLRFLDGDIDAHLVADRQGCTRATLIFFKGKQACI